MNFLALTSLSAVLHGHIALRLIPGLRKAGTAGVPAPQYRRCG